MQAIWSMGGGNFAVSNKKSQVVKEFLKWII